MGEGLTDLKKENIDVLEKRKRDEKKKKTQIRLITILVFLLIIFIASCSATIYFVIKYVNATENLPIVIIAENVVAEVKCSYGEDETTPNIIMCGNNEVMRFDGDENYELNTKNFNGINFVMSRFQREVYIKYVITNTNEELGIAVQQNFTLNDQNDNINYDFKIINNNNQTQYGEFPNYLIINKGCSGTIIVRLKMKDPRENINLTGNMQFMIQKVQEQQV